MLRRLKTLFAPESPPVADPRERMRLATAALLMEAARMDGGVDPEEETRIEVLLRERFGLDAADAAELVEAAHVETQHAVELHGYARTLVDALSESERLEVVEMMWETVLADGRLHHLESSLLRRVAGLLYVSDRDSGLARQRAQARIAGRAPGGLER